MNYTSKSIIVLQDHIIHNISNYYIEKEEIIYILVYKVKPTNYTLYLLYSSYLSMNLDIFIYTSINILHTSLHILVRLNFKDLLNIYQEIYKNELSLFKTSTYLIKDSIVLSRISIEENNDSKLTHISPKD